MANPLSPQNGEGQSLDYLITDAGVAKLKRGKGAYAPTGSVDGSADMTVQGAGAAGAAVAGDPVLIGGSDGTDARTIITDTVGRIVLAGGAGTDTTDSSTGAASALTATLAAATGKTTYITGFEVTGGGATAASVVLVTVTGTITGTLNYYLAIPAGAAVGTVPLIVAFARPIPGSAVNTAVVVNVPSFGAGNTQAAVAAHGYQL